MERRLEVLARIGLVALAAVLLLYGLSDRYLWQDEAETAILASRLLKFGRPLAYDGVNLIGTDNYDPDDQAIERQASDANAGLQYHLQRREFKADTSWKWQPWGLFVITALSLKLLGSTTFAARLPFALAGIATVLLLYQLVRKYSGSFVMAVLAALLLICNPYWILHSRQCRYYALSSLMLVVTVLAYSRWQDRAKGGGLALIAAAFCFFQVDYGTVWPVLGVLFLDAFLSRRRSWSHVAAMGIAVAAILAPFVYYYELWSRTAGQGGDWKERFRLNLFNMNEYVMPALVLLGAAAVLAWRWKSLPDPERRLVLVFGGILLALIGWVPLVSVLPFLRYTIIAAPLACFLIAWMLIRGFASRAQVLAWPAAALLIATPWASLPLHALAPPPPWYTRCKWYRAEFSTLHAGLTHQPDPNRLVIEWLRQNAAPSDEILINYEDKPLMFYLPNPIRGGIAAFRVHDDASGGPRFLVLRQSASFVNWPVYLREVRRYDWVQVPIQAPDMPWGNNPDPLSQAIDPAQQRSLYLAKRVDR